MCAKSNVKDESKKTKKAKARPTYLDDMAAIHVDGETLTVITEPTDEHYDFSYTQNRELSWLAFDRRVLEEAFDESIPLFERLKMASIFESNMDEFCMVRMGGLGDLASLKHPPVDNKSNQTPQEQLDSLYAEAPKLIAEHDDAVTKVEAALAAKGIVRLGWSDLAGEDLKRARQFFNDSIAPLASPQIIGARHPFPNLRNGELYTAFNLASLDEDDLLGIIEVPAGLPRIVELPHDAHGFRYTLVDDVMLACGTELFGEYQTTERAVIRVTRNAEIDPDEGSFDLEDDYRDHMKKILKQRLRLNPVRLSVQGDLNKTLVKRMRKALGLVDGQVWRVKSPLRMSDFAFSLEGKVGPVLSHGLTYPAFSPQACPNVKSDVPMHTQIMAGDIILRYPYESMEPFLRLLHEAATDPDCMQIKITLYRVAKKSRLCESLIAAAENGVDVTVLMELRARFDEENNIEWAERLEDAGCTVIYGSSGFKVHSKICQVTYRIDGEVVRITQLGTGNYNEKTAGLYCDYSLMTADKRIGDDAAKFFRNMQIGKLDGEYAQLGVAPVGLKPLIMRGLDREISKAQAGQEAYVCFKMNSITDREVIDKLSEASCAGVKVNLIVRGICCLVPGIPGKTENITVRNIVGRMLEHARVYTFGVEHEPMYMSSADMMTRNTEHRVEIAFPVLDKRIRDIVWSDVATQLADNTKARELQPDGTYAKVTVKDGDVLVGAQDTFIKNALAAAALEDMREAKAIRNRRRRAIAAPGAQTEEAIAVTAAGEADALEPIETEETEQDAEQMVATTAEEAGEDVETSPATAEGTSEGEAAASEENEPQLDGEGIGVDGLIAPGSCPEEVEEEIVEVMAEDTEALTEQPADEASVAEEDVADVTVAEAAATEDSPAGDAPVEEEADGEIQDAEVIDLDNDVPPEEDAAEELEAKTIASPEDLLAAEEEAKGKNFSTALSRYVDSKGRLKAAWSIIKLGIRVLFGRIDK